MSLQEADESLSFEEQIVEAAKSIAAATGALIKAATAAQRELVAQGKVGSYSGDYDEDSQWSQGLIFAVSGNEYFVILLVILLKAASRWALNNDLVEETFCEV